MPAAPNLLTLLQFEPQIETAALTVLTDAGVPAVRQHGATKLSTPRTEVKLHLGAPTGHKFVPPTGSALYSPGDTYPDAFDAQLILTTVTNRTEVRGNADLHDELVGKSRLVMMQAKGTLNTALSYLTIQNIVAIGVMPDIRPDADLDVSPLIFAVRFAIRTEAWPLEVTVA